MLSSHMATRGWLIYYMRTHMRDYVHDNWLGAVHQGMEYAQLLHCQINLLDEQDSCYYRY